MLHHVQRKDMVELILNKKKSIYIFYLLEV